MLSDEVPGMEYITSQRFSSHSSPREATTRSSDRRPRQSWDKEEKEMNERANERTKRMEIETEIYVHRFSSPR
jgi:hypothetical protein